MRYAYYPGCSLERSAAAYNTSTHRIAEILGIELEEIDDWNCCGATEYFSIDAIPAYSLIARNLALVKPDLHEVVAPCSLCYVNLRKTDKYMGKYPKLAEQVNQALGAGGLAYKPGSVRIRHILDIVVNDVGYEAVKSRVVTPLTGLRIAPYYGCLIVRPDDGFDNPEYPTSLDKLMGSLGAEVIDFPLKAQCCGGHMTQISDKVAYEMIRRILQNASQYKADVIVTLCPMCQLNLDAYQNNVNRQYGTDFNIPILYFTQVLGLALGLEQNQLGFGSEIIPARLMLAKIGMQPGPAEPQGARPGKDNLPMPQMPRKEV
jgi:heterodisulfide reductase subunit B2